MLTKYALRKICYFAATNPGTPFYAYPKMIDDIRIDRYKMWAIYDALGEDDNYFFLLRDMKRPGGIHFDPESRTFSWIGPIVKAPEDFSDAFLEKISAYAQAVIAEDKKAKEYYQELQEAPAKNLIAHIEKHLAKLQSMGYQVVFEYFKK